MPPEASGLFRQTNRKGCRYTIRVLFGWEKPCAEPPLSSYRLATGEVKATSGADTSRLARSTSPQTDSSNGGEVPETRPSPPEEGPEK